MWSWWATLRLRLRGALRPSRVAEEIADELRDHVRAEARGLEARGMAPQDARVEALRRFGNLERIGRECGEAYYLRRRANTPMMRDVRYAIRSMRQHVGFTTVAVVTLALGIGGNAGIFALVYGVVLRPLPYVSPDQLVQLWHKYEDVGLLQASVSPPNYRDYRNEREVFQGVAAYVGQNLTVTARGTPFRLDGLRVTPDFFDVLRVGAARGRVFVEAESEPGAVPVAVLSHSAWRARFGGAEAVIGQSVVLNDVAFEVVGVLPPDFMFHVAADVFIPLSFTPDQLADERRGQEFLRVIGRLAEGVTFDAAVERMNAVAARIDGQYGMGGYGIDLVPLHQEVIGGDVRPALLVLLGAVGFVLLIACVNLASLLYARAETRQREIALRTALGATRGQLLRQLITESVLLGVFGGALGLAAAAWGIRALAALPGIALPRADEIGVDGVVMAFTVFLALLTGIVFGTGPALGITRHPVASALQEGGHRSHGHRRGGAVRRALIVSEVSLAMVLLTGAGLMLKSFSRLSAVDPGFDASGVLTLRVDLPPARYPSPAARAGLYGRLIEQVRALPGVRSAAGIVPTPMSGVNPSGSFMIEGEVYDDDHPIPNTKMRMVTDGYFQTMRIPVVMGRTFNAFDTAENPRVLVVDETFVRRYLPDRDPLAARIGFPGNWSPIVGVVGDVQDVQLGGAINGHIYNSHAQLGPPFLGLIVRTDLPPADLVPTVVDAVHGLDSDLAPFDIQTMADRVRSTIAHDRFVSFLLACFAGVALSLAAVGVYGVLSYSMARRINEIGVRTALGARRLDVVKLAMWEGMRPAVIGAVVGLAGSVATMRWLRSQLFGVSETDPAVFTMTPAVLLGVALIACLVPVLRATRVPPIEALRQ